MRLTIVPQLNYILLLVHLFYASLFHRLELITYYHFYYIVGSVVSANL